MKEEICSQMAEIPNILSFSESTNFYKQVDKDNCNKNKSENNNLCNEIKKQMETKIFENKENSSDNNNNNNLRKEEKYLLNILKNLNNEKFTTNNFNKKEKIEFLTNHIKTEVNDCKNGFQILPDDMIHLFVATNFEVDYNRSSDIKPNWLDMEKFKRGQKFAMDYFFGVSYAQLLSLFILFAFEDGVKPLIFTEKSSTPYTAFKRYISTGQRVRNWYTKDPWTKNTAAYNDIQTVRKMHSAVRQKLKNTDNKIIDEKTKIKNPTCPTRDILVEDFQSSCPAPKLGQCPYLLYNNPELYSLRPKGLNQADMVSTQFGFMGLIILYPKYFGIFYATEDDLEAFCHLWRGIGYLLGIDDEFNFCRGTLNEVRERCRNFLEYWAKPNFRELTPECEHMMRCVVEGLKYYVPGNYYETCVLYLAEILNLHTPRLYSSLTYKIWMRHLFLKFLYQYGCQVPAVVTSLNGKINIALDNALNYSAEKHEELKKKSEELFKKNIE
ncbi:uncharacterized protein LOC127281263 [Leptopilina boulardi]|uniref:uncharacterized protein LOC127281263 n=1 Tax=Leptopilina boulardi TaxID=63433 RepID=UPI0021F5BFE4|nr:uncharacterized protein LOC127281263 [Leptopilina boulardi]